MLFKLIDHSKTSFYKNKNMIKKNFYVIKLQLLLIIYSFFLMYHKYNINENFKDFDINKNKINLDYENHSFAILRRTNCRYCGLFSYFIVYLGCINKYVSLGYIPIIDLKSFPNIFNKMNASLLNSNPWELFFYQPFRYTLENIEKKVKKLKYFRCFGNEIRPNDDIFFNDILLDFWHKIAKFYIPIKNEVLTEANYIFKKLFKNSKNILGIFVRGTDYISRKPKNHPIPPKPETVIKDIKELDKKYIYDWFFIATEDDIIREKFIKEFRNKLKYLKMNNQNFNCKKDKYFSLFIYYINLAVFVRCVIY